MNNKDLENRLIEYAVLVIKVAERIRCKESGKHLSQQIIWSGTSPALNYGEAQSAESKKDFIHKLKITTKELRETYVALKIIDKIQIVDEEDDLRSVIYECNQLIAIFITIIKTSQRNLALC